jgi:flavorubredoxin
MHAPRASIHRVAADTWRVSVAIPPSVIPGGFSFNQYLVVDDQPLLFHTGPRKLFPLIREQIETVMPVAKLRYVAFSHVESDECGALPDFLAAAPQAQPVCGRVAAMLSICDVVDVERTPPLAMNDGDVLNLGRHELVWQATPHLPHGWECGFFYDRTTGTLFCGDLFTQPGTGDEPLTRGDILTPSEAFRRQEDYYSHTANAPALIDKLARLKPKVLACMHGSAWEGDGEAMLRRLGAALAA